MNRKDILAMRKGVERVCDSVFDNMEIEVDNKKMIVKEFFDWDTVMFLRRKDKRCGRELSI